MSSGIARLVGIAGEAEGRVAELPPGLYNIGCGPSAQIAFPSDETLADIQAALFRQNGTWFLVDSGLGEGIHVNDSRVGRYAVPLSSGSTIRCGRQVLRIDYEETGAIGPIRSSMKKPAVSPPIVFK